VPTQSGRDPKVANHLPSSRRFLPLPTTHNAQLKPFFRRLLPLPKTQVSSRKSLRAFTLIELIIVMGILVILFNLLMVPMMMGLKLTSSTRQAVEAQDDARMALELMKKDVARAMYVLPNGPWQTTSLTARTALQAALPPSETATMTVGDASNFPASGVVAMGAPTSGYEIIAYSSHTNTTLDGLTRGQWPTTVLDHPISTPVLLLTWPKTEAAKLPVANAANFPPSGLVAVGSVPFGYEIIAYSSHTNTTLDGLTRAQDRTTAIDHSASERVMFLGTSDADTFVTSRLDLIMPKTDSHGQAIQPLTPDPKMVRYYVAPARINSASTEGWPKYWNPFQLPTVGVPPVRGGVARLYVLYRVVIDLDRIKNDPTYELGPGPSGPCDPWRPDFYDDSNLSPVAFSTTQPASFSFWWRRKSTALTPVESADLALYVHSKGLTAPSELRPLEVVLPTGQRVAAPGFAAVPVRKEKEQLIPNVRGNPTKYFASLPLWSEWPQPSLTLSNGNPAPGDEFWTTDLTTGALDFALPRTEFFDGDGALTGTFSHDGDLTPIAANIYDVSLNIPAHLTAPLSAAETVSMTVDEAASFPASGVVTIDNEQIAYTSHTNTTLNGLTRGLNGTTPVAHTTGTSVFAFDRGGPLAHLTADLSDVETGSMTLDEAASFPTSGVVTIDNEQIAYTSHTNTTLNGLTRGLNGTTPVAHTAGTDVGLLPINDFVIIPGSETIQVIDSSGNILDYTRGTESDPANIEENHYFIDYEAGRITFTSGFNSAAPTKDVIIRFQYRRNLLREEITGQPGKLRKLSGSDDNVIVSYSSLASIDVQLVLASYSNSRVPSDEFRLASRLELGNAPR